MGKDETAGQEPTFEKAGSRAHRTNEAVEKNQRSVDAAVRPGTPPPDPGMEEDYGKRSGEIPSQEPANPKKGEVPEAT